MCGPATAPMTCAWTPRWPSASTSRAVVFSWPAVSGLTCSAVERLRMRASGRWNSTSPGSRCSSGGSSSASCGRRLGRLGLAARARARSAPAPRPRAAPAGRRRPRRGRGSAARRRARRVRVAGRMTTSSSSRSGGSSGWVASGSRSGSRRGRGGGRSVRAVSTTCSPVARSTPATVAPVSSSRAAQNRKMARMCAPTSENRRVDGVGHDLAEVPAALGHRRAVARPEAQRAHREPQAGRGEQAQRARAEGPHARGQRGAQDEQGAGGHERHRRRPRDAADRPT